MSGKHILLLQPWIEDFYETKCRSEPLGLCYLAGSLKRHFPHITTTILDFRSIESKTTTIPWPKEFIYLKRYYTQWEKGPFGLFNRYQRFGTPVTIIREKLSGLTQPLYIGISSLFTPYYRESLKLALICKQIWPSCPIVMGGSHATMHPETLLHPANHEFTGACDYVLQGEADNSIVQFTNYILGNTKREQVENLVNKDSPITKNSLITPSWQDIAEPDYSSLDTSAYLYQKKKMRFLVTSRSCPFQCSFCSIHQVFGKKYRTESIDNIIDRINRFYHDGIEHIDIEDDNFTVDHKRTEDFLQRIISLNLPITFSAMNGICYYTLTQSLVTLLKRANFTGLNLSLVSSNIDNLNSLDRFGNIELFRSIVFTANEINLPVTAYFIIGMPDQSLQEMIDTFTFLCTLPVELGISPFYFTPGSKIHSKYQNSNTIKLASRTKDPFFSARLTAMDLESDEFTRDDIFTLFKLTRIVNSAKSQNREHNKITRDLIIQIITKKTWEVLSDQCKDTPISTRVLDLLDKNDTFQKWLIK